MLNLLVDKEVATMTDDELDRIFAALSDRTRRAILRRLTEGEATVNELAAPFPMSLQAVSKHLKVLERAGLITQGRHAQWRPCRLDAGPLAAADAWLAHYEQFWDLRFDQLTDHLTPTRIKEQP